MCDKNLALCSNFCSLSLSWHSHNALSLFSPSPSQTVGKEEGHKWIQAKRYTQGEAGEKNKTNSDEWKRKNGHHLLFALRLYLFLCLVPCLWYVWHGMGWGTGTSGKNRRLGDRSGENRSGGVCWEIRGLRQKKKTENTWPGSCVQQASSIVYMACVSLPCLSFSLYAPLYSSPRKGKFYPSYSVVSESRALHLPPHTAAPRYTPCLPAHIYT